MILLNTPWSLFLTMNICPSEQIFIIVFCPPVKWALSTSETSPSSRKKAHMGWLQMGARCQTFRSFGKKALQNWLTDHNRISCTRMAMQRSTTVADLLRILFNWTQHRWCSGLWASLLLDDVVHAFGSVSQDTVRSSLLSAGVHPSLTDLILYTVQHVTLHMGGHQGVRLFRAMDKAGMGQGDLIFALLYCLLNEIRVQLVLQFAGLADTPGGPLRNLGRIADSSLIGTSHSDIQRVASRLPIAGNLTNLFSDATKTMRFGTALQGKRVTFGRQPIHFSGMPLCIPEEGDYIWLLGRHALPHVFHRQDLRKLMASYCRAVAPVSMSTLPAHYPIHMYNALCWRHPQVELCDMPAPAPCNAFGQLTSSLPFAKLLEHQCGSSPELFLQPVTSGWTGLCSALPTIVLSFMSTYQHQLNHRNSRVKASTRHGLLWALTRFHWDMPCLQQGILHVCPAHSDDHSLFVIWCHRLFVDVHVPPHWLHMPLLQCPLYQATLQWQVEDAHVWMAIPYHSEAMPSNRDGLSAFVPPPSRSNSQMPSLR